MENEKTTEEQPLKSIVPQDSRLYIFTEKSLSEIDSALKWAQAIAEGGSLPDKYYEKTKTEGVTEDRWPVDYTKPICGLILAVVSAGKEIGLSPFASLNMIVPIYGKMAIKGDGAKAMIFSSGLVKEWKETASGNIDKDDYQYTITSTRTSGTTITRSFGVREAKRADLWVTQQKLNGNQGAMHRQSPWYRYPDRMCMYRGLGFISRDLYPDVLGQLVILEEINDYPDVSVKIIDTKGGPVAITDIDGKTQKSEQLTGAVADKVTKRHEKLGLGDKDKNKLRETAEDLKKIEPGKEKPEPGKKKVKIDPSPISRKEAFTGFAEDQLLKMGTKIYDLAKKCCLDGISIVDEIDKLPGKKSNKKYRLAILAFQKGRFTNYIESQAPAVPPAETPPGTKIGPEDTESIPKKETVSHPALDDEKETPQQEEDQISEEYSPSSEKSNPFGIEISEIEEGHRERDFQKARSIALQLADNGFNNATYQELASRIYFSKEHKITYRSKFDDLEYFLKNAPAVDIHYLLTRYDS